MPLLAGQRLGPFEIVAELGAGGMGQVFRGRDRSLQRDVALKVLPDAFAHDASRVARFKREAQVLASLNHPNIAAIYGLHEGDGVVALALEVVEGHDLSERIASGPIPIPESLDIARQVANALDEAHEHGIVHRDLKPGNIRITNEGKVKVLDFGLAQVRTDDAQEENATATGALTEAGAIMGTPAYMSPEQARGKPVGKRTDIWAFGATLFEMLSGKRPFKGGTASDLIAAILTTEPDWSAIPAQTPEPVKDLLRACLEKEPRERLRDLGDARHALAAQAGERNAGLPRAASREAGVQGPRLLVATIAGIAIGAALFGFIGWIRSRGAAAPEPVRLSINPPAGVTLAVGRGSSLAVSPDGKRLVFAGREKEKTQLYLRPLDQFTSTAIPGTEGATNPFFSPEGQWVGFFADGRLKKVSIDGGAPVDLGEVLNSRGEAWGPDDRIYVTRTNAVGVSRVSGSGGAFEEVTKLRQREFSHRWPRALPTGGLLYSVWNDTGWETARILGLTRVTPDAEPREVVPSGGGYPHFLGDPVLGVDYLVYARSEGLLAARFDPSRLQVIGQVIPIVDGVLTNLSGGAHFDISRSGVLAYLPGAVSEARRPLEWFSLDGKSTPAGTLENSGRLFALAPDGVSVIGASVSGGPALWVQNLETHVVRHLPNAEQSYSPQFSGDGLYLIYARGIPMLNIWRRRADGSGEEERLTSVPRSQFIESVSPDGRTLMIQEAGDRGGDLVTLEIPADHRPGDPLPQTKPFVASPAFEQSPTFSPDGRWVAYASNDSGRFEIFAKAFPPTEGRALISNGGGFNPVWSPDGKTLFYRSARGLLMAVPYEVKGGELLVGKERVLFDVTRYENRFEVSPDGKRLLLMPLQATESAATQIQVVLNFVEDLRRRVR